MKRLILILFSLWVVWSQTPLASRCDASAAPKTCNCCTGCGGACGCVAPTSGDQTPLPLALPTTALQTELLFPATPAFSLALPFALSVDNFHSSFAAASAFAVPLFRRDCALRL